MTFAEWVSAYTAGYIAHRDGLDDSDGEAFLTAMHDDWQESGTQRAKREIEALTHVGDALTYANPPREIEPRADSLGRPAR